MATFPTFSNNRTHEPFEEDPIDGRIQVRAADGTQRVRFAVASLVLADYVFQYPYLTKTDWANLITFYNTNRTIPFDFSLHDGASATTVQMMFTARPKRRIRNGESLSVTINMMRVS